MNETAEIPARSVRRFLMAAAAATLAILATVGAFNGIVDPLGALRLVDKPGFNHSKPGLYTRVRVAKAYDVRRIAPRAIILGTSRSHLGLRPSHDGWYPTASPRYNLAFDGATTKEMYLFLRHADSVAPLEQVVLGIDTYHLSSAPASTRPGFIEDALLTDSGPLARLRVALTDLRLLVSMDTLLLSIETLRGQWHPEPEWFAPDGQRLGEVFFRRPGEVFHDQSPREYFLAYDRRELGYQMGASKPGGAKLPYAKAPPAPTDTSFDYLRRIIEYCRDHRIDLRIFTTPTHARNLEISAATGAWPFIEAGKRKLVALLAEDAAAHPGEKPFPLYDFVDYSSITTESLPAPGGKEEMANFWDSSHFKEGVGDLVLDRLLGTNLPSRPIPQDFGVRLETGNVEAHLTAVRQHQAEYRASHPDEAAAIAAMIESRRQGNS
jgi:hypothetical protein